MADTNKRNLIRLDDSGLGRPIYRIYALDRFRALLASKQDVVVNPTKWDDPFEDFFLERTEVADHASGGTIPLRNLAGDWYGQCWSLNKDTDAMWRIYSPEPLKQVGVRSAPRSGSSSRTSRRPGRRHLTSSFSSARSSICLSSVLEA
jgi:hypothetical protein